jgi:protocatechuate 3,4-dioxygenase beta subunit
MGSPIRRANALSIVYHDTTFVKEYYNTTGLRLRGHQFTDKQERFHLETIVPGEYPGQSVLTTQLYFPGEPRNNSDSIFSPELFKSSTGSLERHRRCM